MSTEEMRLILRRLVDEFEGDGMTSNEVRAYTRHLQHLPFDAVNIGIDTIVKRGAFSRPVPGAVLRSTPGVSFGRAALLEERAEFQKWRDNYAEILARKPGDSREALQHAIAQADELLADVDRKLAA